MLLDLVAYFTVRGRPAPLRTMRGHTESVWAVAFFKDGRRVVTGSRDCTLRISDVLKGTLIDGPFEGHKGWVNSVAVSPDDRRIASAGDDNTIIIWDVESKQTVLGRLVKHTGSVYSVSFSPDGTRLASGSRDTTVIVWDAKTGTVLATLRGHHNWVLSVVFSPDGLKLASASRDHTIRVWHTDNADFLFKINAHEDWVKSVVWSPDSHQLVSASFDKTIRFWDSSKGDQIGQVCVGHTHHIHSLAISSDGDFIATASDDKTVRLWSTKSHQQIGHALEHTAGAESVAISPNGGLLAIGGSDGKVRVWSNKNILEQQKVKERPIIKRLLTAVNPPSTPHIDEPARSDIQLFSHDTDSETCGDHESTHNHFSEVHETVCSHEKHDILVINTMVRNACIAGDLHTAEELLTQEINADNTNYNSYANRSVVRARNSQWDYALQDAVESIAIQPSLMGFISKGIALCGKEMIWHAMEAFNLAFIFSKNDPATTTLLRLIKAIALFNANHYDEAMREVQDVAMACQDLDTLPCSVVDSYLRVQHGIISFEGLFLRRTLFEPSLKIFTVLFGWELDFLWQTANQRRCDAFLRADRVVEAVESHRYMMLMIDDAARKSCFEWSNTFKQDCTSRCIAMGDEALYANNYKRAIDLYSAGIRLDSSCDSLLAHRSKANLAADLHAEALHDAEQVIELTPSSYIGYERKHAALHGTQRYDEAIEAFKVMLAKMGDSPDARVRQMRLQYVSPSEADDAIRRIIHAQLENAPLRLLNTFTGYLCDREAQTNAFMESTEYKELMSSLMTHTHLQMEPIKEAVANYFGWVMLSHRWERKEPLLLDVQNKVVYDLDPVKTMVKLQTFCKTSRGAGYRWAWSDTCCIDQNNNAELQRSVNSMFIWYRHSSLTIIYLSDVPPSSKSGALANCVWNTRGWTVQEFLAPTVVLFYQADWTLYLNDRSPNHKESVAIMEELEVSTGINARALVAFRPGMRGAREKLQWASTRVTTLQEDIVYSLFGIFGVHLPVIYGEKKQNALGRLLQEIIAHSGDITALDWVGKSSTFNSCLPADISSYKALPCTLPHLPEDEIRTLVSSLRNATTVESASSLYALLNNLSAPRFANSRLHLPCLAFPVTEVKRRRRRDREMYFTYEVKADGLQDLLITTEDRLIQFSPTRPTRQTFLLVRPWDRYDLGLPDFADYTQSVDGWSEFEAPSDESLSVHPGGGGSVDSESRELRLIVRLGQPFGALFLAHQRGGEYKRIASDHNIISRVKDIASVHDMMDVRTLEIL